MEQKYDLTNIATMQFESEAMPEFNFERESNSYRLTAAQVNSMPDAEANHLALRRKLSVYFSTKLDEKYEKLEGECLIKRNTYQKAMNFKSTRHITYDILARFCIGAGLTEEEARELFVLQGHELSVKNKADYILLHYLHTKEGIEDYGKDMVEYCGMKEESFEL